MKDELRKILESLGEVLAHETDGYSPETKKGKEWIERINYEWQDGIKFEYDDVENEAVDAILELFNKQLPDVYDVMKRATPPDDPRKVVQEAWERGINSCLADIRRAAGLEG